MLGAANLEIGLWDSLVIVLYLAGIVGLGCWAGLRGRGRGGKNFFLAGRSLTWPVIGLALFSTNISTVHLVSLAEQGYKNGLVYGNFEWMAAFTLIVLALFFAPFYIRTKVATLPDFLERRYDHRSRLWLSLLSIISAVFIHIGCSLYAGAVVLHGLFNLDILWSIVAVALLTGLYTIIGGLAAVVWTESIQTVVLIAGAVCITAIALVRVGGWGGLTTNIPPGSMEMLRPAGDASGLAWYTVFLGYPVIGIWYWCTDQTIVQRVLGAKDEDHARLGALFAGFIKILPVFIFVLPGLICLGLVHKGAVPGRPEHASDTYAFMIKALLPVGLKGVVAAALLAALMSTVSGALNSIATLFSMDFYKRLRPEASDRKLVRVGRIATFVAMAAAIAWSPQVGRLSSSIFDSISLMICYLAPPITTVFLWGVFWRRASATASFYTLVTGSILGLAVFLLSEFKETTGWDLHYMLAGFYLFLVCSLLLAVLSFFFPQEEDEEKLRLVWNNPLSALSAPGRRGLGNYKFLALLLFLVMVGLYLVF